MTSPCNRLRMTVTAAGLVALRSERIIDCPVRTTVIGVDWADKTTATTATVTDTSARRTSIGKDTACLVLRAAVPPWRCDHQEREPGDPESLAEHPQASGPVKVGRPDCRCARAPVELLEFGSELRVVERCGMTDPGTVEAIHHRREPGPKRFPRMRGDGNPALSM